jgi:hypothetical protein
MAQLVLTNADITVNGVVLSDRANSVTLTYEVDSVEVTAFGDTGHKFAGGLQNISCEISFQQDFAAGEVEATIYGLVGQTTTVTVRPGAQATSATNPLYTLSNTFLGAHTPVMGAVGELAMTELTFTGGTLAKSTGA